jgi:hypothetical protein
MFNVLLIDRSNPAFFDLAIDLSRLINNDNIKIIFLSDKKNSGMYGELEVINIADIPQSKSLSELQLVFNFSLHRALVPERAFFDYSSFRQSQRYSDMSLDEVYLSAQPYINALDYLIRERVDLVMEGLADNFMTSVAGRLAGVYKKKFFMAFIYYWFDNGFLMADRMDQTCTLVEEKYRQNLAHQDSLDREQLDLFYSRKILHPHFPNNYTIKSRFRQLINRFNSYERPSFKNFVLRRLSWGIAKLQIKMFIVFEKKIRSEKFVLFPLHVTPEATLLGSSPELADQFALIKNVSMNLPIGVYLYIKEHPYQVMGAGLDYQFYKKIKSLPNVRIFSADLTASKIYNDNNCLAVIVISGTVGLEAAIQKVPVFVFGRPIYGAANCFIKPKDFEEFFTALQSIMKKEYSFDEPALYAMLKALKESVIGIEIELSKANSWLELSYMTNAITAKFIDQQYIEWSKFKII